jgi:cytidyltransferase-like protein
VNVVTIGTFDRFHYGHERLLSRCSDFLGTNGKLTVGVNSDSFVRQYKNVPVQPIEVRVARVQEEIAHIPSKVRVHYGHTGAFIADIKPCIIVIGSDWGRRDYLAQLGIDWDWLDLHGIGLCYINYTHGISSTALREADLGPYFEGSVRDKEDPR